MPVVDVAQPDDAHRLLAGQLVDRETGHVVDARCHPLVPGRDSFEGAWSRQIALRAVGRHGVEPAVYHWYQIALQRAQADALATERDDEGVLAGGVVAIGHRTASGANTCASSGLS